MVKLLTMKEMAEDANMSLYTIRKLVKTGVVPFVTIGNKCLIDKEMFYEALRLEAKENQARQKQLTESKQPQKIVHYGKFQDLNLLGEVIRWIMIFLHTVKMHSLTC